MFAREIDDRIAISRFTPGTSLPRPITNGVSIRTLPIRTPTTRMLTAIACLTRNAGLISMPIDEKNNAANMSRTGSKRCTALEDKSLGAVFISIPDKKAPTSAEFNTFSVIIVITTHKVTTPSRNRSCDFEPCRALKQTGHIQRHTRIIHAITSSFMSTIINILSMLPPADTTGITASMIAKQMSCITRIPTVIFPAAVLISLVSISPLTTMVVEDIASTHPKKQLEDTLIPAMEVPARHEMPITTSICSIPPKIATRRTRTRFETENSHPSPKRRNVAPSCASVST
mmetsp:Transcript_8592/g.13573  ORF Transcript_8592/g.13573 Transcript_8592/m.13573 type:complete len:287 (+) Transcript_8592:497-1357(+)